MANLDIATTTVTDTTADVITIPSMTTDGVSNKETTFVNTNWPKYWGYFSTISDLKSALLMKAMWNVGKGFTTDTRTQVILDRIHGWGKDTFEDIIFNMEVIKRVGGDSFAEIIRNPETGTLINLKPLDPGVIRTVVDDKGIIVRFEQLSKIDSKKVAHRFEPKDIFMLSNNRLADQIHGISDIESLEDTIKAEHQTFGDTNDIVHKMARPLILFKLGTDDQTKINTFADKMEKALENNRKNIYMPNDKDAVDFEIIQLNVSSLILEWRNDIRNKFYRTIGLPQIVPGAGGQSTESESKAILAAFEVIVESDQKKLERQIWEQLALKVDFVHPSIMSDQLKADEAKDANIATSFQPNDTQVGSGR